MTSDRLFLGTMASWLAMLAAIAIVVGSGLYPKEIGDPDISGHAELAFTIIVLTFLPLLLISVGVFLPVMWIVTRLKVWRPGRFGNSVLGASLAVPALGVMALVGQLLGWRARGPISIHTIILLAIGGLVFGLCAPTSRTTRTNPITNE